jgi:hypothetical protein
MRKRALAVVGAVVAIVGAAFTLQGFGILGGSFMSGSGAWALTGLLMVVVGVTAYGFGTRTP